MRSVATHGGPDTVSGSATDETFWTGAGDDSCTNVEAPTNCETTS